jgi:hypothetical protein
MVEVIETFRILTVTGALSLYELEAGPDTRYPNREAIAVTARLFGGTPQLARWASEVARGMMTVA